MHAPREEKSFHRKNNSKRHPKIRCNKIPAGLSRSQRLVSIPAGSRWKRLQVLSERPWFNVRPDRQRLKTIENTYLFHRKNRFDSAAGAASNECLISVSLLSEARGDYEKHFHGPARHLPGNF